MQTFGSKHKCGYCGQDETCTRDHFIPKSLGGKVMVWACEICQGTKKNYMPHEWVAYLRNHILFDKVMVDVVEAVVKSIYAFINSKAPGHAYKETKAKLKVQNDILRTVVSTGKKIPHTSIYSLKKSKQ